MRAGSYAILDEPKPGGLARLVVNPFWPLLAGMMAGWWLAGPWFILNAFAIGSATRKSETWLVFGSVVAAFAFAFAVGFALTLYPIDNRLVFPYLRIALDVIKLGFAYVVWMMQSRSIALYTYYGGLVRNGALPLIAGVALRTNFPDLPWWARLVLGV